MPAIAAVSLATSGPADDHSSSSRADTQVQAGVGWGLLAGCGFGLLFVAAD